MLSEYKGSRVRLKAIGGGGGKGQRILSDASLVPGWPRDLGKRSRHWRRRQQEHLIELNIEQTRHNEIQLLGNGGGA